MRAAAIVPVALAGLPAAHAWGALGHSTVAYIAQNLIQPKTVTWAQGILGDTSSTYLVNISSWADSYRSQPGGAFSSPFHYIDAQDSPPKTCNVDYDRDCTDAGCVVSAISNYTRRVTQTSLSKQERNYALRFIVHFLGDVHQPLHNENYALGGNDIDVTFNGADRNLHGIWDTQIPERIRGASYTVAEAKQWAAELTTEVKSGDYAASSKSWKTVNVNDAINQALAWSNEANDYVCTTVVPKGWTAVESGDLATNGYYDSVVSTVELQIARAGVRLAAWLDALAGATKSARDVEPEFDLSGRDLLPAKRRLTRAQLARRAAGAGCGCAEHEH
ncbi:nuclease S1 [Elsinoe australis]|uniref:Nuclease S1 n=1 Tax=Elsinoe australis TaxID=40998 RepID=A0A4U7ARI0_9PEZI|nr:nuclease S1 [Elsinoe australis]